MFSKEEEQEKFDAYDDALHLLQQFIVLPPIPAAVINLSYDYVLYTQEWANYFELQKLGDLTGQNHYKDVFVNAEQDQPHWKEITDHAFKFGNKIISKDEGEKYTLPSGKTVHFSWECLPIPSRKDSGKISHVLFVILPVCDCH